MIFKPLESAAESGPRGGSAGVRPAAEILTLQEAESLLRQLAGAGWQPPGSLDSSQFGLPRPAGLVARHGSGSSDEEKSRRSESRYRNLIEQLPAVTFMAVLDGEEDNELYVSPQIEALLGFSQKEWLEDPVLWYRQLHQDDRVRWHDEFALTCSAGTHFRDEYRFIARDGRVVWVHGEAQVVRDEQGNPLFLQGIAFDITESKQAGEALRRAHDELARANSGLQREARERERAEETLLRANADLVEARDRAVEASRVKSTFLANMSHELRTPLNAVIGYSELIQERAAQNIPKDPSAELEKIIRAGKHLLSIINDILDLSKIEVGKVEILPERFGIVEMIREAVAAVQPQLVKNANSLEICCDDDLGTMYTDVTRLRQCLLNLLSNACKFTKNGTVRLEVVRETGSGGDRVIFRVQDSGIGITSAQIDRLFQAFSQADASTTRKYGGTGLGLAITKKLSQMLGGDVSVESMPGRGSTFCVQVPATLGS